MVFESVPETNGQTFFEYEERVDIKPQPEQQPESYNTIEDFIRSCIQEFRNAIPIFKADQQHEEIDDDGLSIDGSFISRNMDPTSEMQKCPAKTTQRKRRSINPIDYPNTDVEHPLRTIRGEYVRIKRSSEGKLRSLRKQMARCARDATGNCEDIQIKYMALVKEINAKLQKFASEILAENGRSKLASEDEAKQLEYANKMEQIKDREREIEHEKQEMSRHFSKFIEEQKTKEKELDERIMKMEKDRLEYDTKFTKADDPRIVLENKQQAVSTKSMDATKMPVIPRILPTDKLIVNPSNEFQSNSKIAATTHSPKVTAKQFEVPNLTPPEHNLLKISVNNANDQIGKIFFGDGFYYASPNDKPIFHQDELVESGHQEFFQNPRNIESMRQWQARVMSDQTPVQISFQNAQQQQSQQQQQQPQQQQQQQSGINQFHNNQQQQTVDQTRFQPIQNQQQQQVPSVTPLKTSDSLSNLGPSGPFMSLCDQMARQNNNFQSKSQNIQPNFATVQDFSGANRQNIPLTGETSTSSSQIMFNPGFSFSPTPICFYPAPATPQYYRMQQPGNAHLWAVQPQPQIVVPGTRFQPTGSLNNLLFVCFT